MYLSNLKPVICWIPPVTGGNGSHPNASKVTLLNRQALPAVKVQIKSRKEKEQPLLQESSIVSSRREMMHLTAVSICFASFFFSASAEARPRNATMRQKIMEKLEELKEKAGLSKPKEEGEGNESKDSKPTNEMSGIMAKLKDTIKATNLGATSEQTPAPEPEKEPSVPLLPPLPPLNILTGGTVETSLS